LTEFIRKANAQVAVEGRIVILLLVIMMVHGFFPGLAFG
jgi:hypothetical protein